MRLADRVSRLWESVTEPRHLKAFYLGVYIVTTFVGIVTLINPPQSIEGRIGTLLSVFWAALLTIGGTCGAISVLPGWWWVERLSVLLILTGAGIYGGLALVAQIQAGPGTSRWTQIGFIILAGAVFVLRLILTRRWDYEPRRG